METEGDLSAAIYEIALLREAWKEGALKSLRVLRVLVVVLILIGIHPNLGSGAVCLARADSASQASGQKPVEQRPTEKRVVYYCPMHRDYRSDSPGKCPKCGMELKAATADSIPPVTPADGNPNPAESVGSPVGSVKVFNIPDTLVLDQNGNQLHFYRDLVKGRTVAIDFIFTTCTTICPPLTATLRKVQSNLGARVGKDISLISVTVDPATDTPERLKEFAARFDAQSGWTFVTGAKPDIDRLLTALGGYTSNPSDHSPIILIGNEAAGYWTRTYGLAPPAKLTEMINNAAARTQHTSVTGAAADHLRTASAQSASASGAGSSSNAAATSTPGSSTASQQPPRVSPAEAAAHYFPDNVLITQDGKPVHFYSDLVKDRVVVIDFMFTTCTGICPAATANLAKVQGYLGSHMGQDVSIISITVDSRTDTPEKLKQYAAQYKAGPGWYFLTGEQSNVDTVLHKLGGYVEDPNDHSTIVIIGNARTGDWAKAFAMARPSVIGDMVLKMVKATSGNAAPKTNTSN